MQTCTRKKNSLHVGSMEGTFKKTIRNSQHVGSMKGIKKTYLKFNFTAGLNKISKCCVKSCSRSRKCGGYGMNAGNQLRFAASSGLRLTIDGSALIKLKKRKKLPSLKAPLYKEVSE